MARRELNLWLAFADVMFLLFLCGLITSAALSKEARAKDVLASVAQDRARIAEANAKSLTAANADLKTRLATIERNRFACAEVDPLLDRLSGCIYSRLGRKDAVGREICSVTVSEDLVRFETGEDLPSEPARATALAQCFCESARWFEQEHPESLQAIETIHIDGFTDCVGDEVRNERLGANRALELYRRLVNEARGSDATSSAWFRRVAVRSFGEERPADGSPCPREAAYENDRRVRFAVDMKLRQANGPQ